MKIGDIKDNTVYCLQCGRELPSCPCGDDQIPGGVNFDYDITHAIKNDKTLYCLQCGCNKPLCVCGPGTTFATQKIMTDMVRAQLNGLALDGKTPTRYFAERNPHMKKQAGIFDLGIRDQFMAFKKNIIRRVQAIPHSAMDEQNKRLHLRTAYKLLGDVIKETRSDPRIVPATLNLSDTPGKK